jgi:CubicO group peptidase (beta-lactamase class C family)
MFSQPRSLPDQPSLRYLKIESKRRLAAGEFASLHDAQLAVAREHGLPSWAALKERVTARPGQEHHAVTQLKWLVSRFGAADGPDWVAPDETELLQHFGERFVAVATPARIVQIFSSRAEQLRDELVVLGDHQDAVRARIGGMQLEAAAEPEPPHRLAGLRMYPVGAAVTDPRVAAPSSRMSGSVPDGVTAIADSAHGEVGLVGLVLAGGAADGGAAGAAEPPWVIARGWAVLAEGQVQAGRAGGGTPEDSRESEPLRPGHRFPAMSVTKLITATTVLRLVADGLAGLDDPVNGHLRSVRLADDTVTIRELLSHSGGIDARLQTFADAVPDLVSLAGPVISCDGQRGEFSYSNAGYAVLGQLVADLSGASYVQAAGNLVLRPLGMTASSFPAAWPGSDPDAVSGYNLEADGMFTLVPGKVCTMPSAGGLWATAADLVRFALSWSSLLPESLSREALRRHVARNAAVHVGLGWNVNSEHGVAGHPGGGPGGSSSLVVRLAEQRAHVAMTNRRVPVEPVNGRVMRATSQPGR